MMSARQRVTHVSRTQAISRRTFLAVGAGLALGRSGITEAATGPEEIIDIHPHVMSLDTNRYPTAPFNNTQSDWSKERPQTFEQLVSEMDAAGIAKAAMVQVSTLYGFDNSYLADSIAKNPKRFTGVCSIDTLAPDAVTVLEGWMRRGMGGLRIYTGGRGPEMLLDPKAIPVWEYAEKKGFPIALSVGSQGLSIVGALAKRHPGVKVILDHLGTPKVEDGPPYVDAQPLFDLAQYRNLFLKVTPISFALVQKGKATPETFFPKLVSVFGADHIAFGSNLPSSAGPMTKLVALARNSLATVTATDRAMILAGTAKRLYPMLA